MFHLMAREGMVLSGKFPNIWYFQIRQRFNSLYIIPALNKTLNTFFTSYGSRLPVDEWYEKYEFLEGYNTHAESEWMSR